MSALDLTIRCPHQKNDDLKIQAKSDWTVRQLKIYLHGSHASKPAPERQRIVFAGQLLRDDARLADYFQRYNANVDGANESNNNYVLHLVYTESVENSMAAAEKRSNDNETELRKRRQAAAGSLSANPAAAGTTTHDAPAPSSPPQPRQNVPSTNTSNSPYFAPYWPWPSTDGPGIVGAADPPSYTTNDWVQQQQQMYTAMMSQWYGQYVQAMYGGGGPPAFYPFSSVTAPPPAPNGGVILQPQLEQQPQQQIPGGVQAAARQPAMNAQGGLAPADVDDDDPRNRDWLDYVYMTCRASLLLMILYFYSSVERFVFVILCCTLLYGLQAGWFGRRAQQQNNEQRQPPRAAVGAAEAANPNAPQPNEAGDDTTATRSVPPPATPADDIPATAWNVFWSTCWTFVSSFFASLVPERPPPLNM